MLNGINDDIDRLLLQEKYKRSILLFSKDIIGIPLAPHQEKWINHIENNTRSLLFAPRGHGKTFTIAHIYVTWRIARDRATRVIFLSNTESAVALESFTLVKEELESNEKLIEVFGKFKGKDKWSNTILKVIRPRRIKEPTVLSLGMQSSITGRGADLIVADDIVTKMNSRTENNREKMRTWFIDEVDPVLRESDTMKMVMIGTPKYYDDLYKTVLETGLFRLRKDKAFVKGNFRDDNNIEYIYESDKYGINNLKEIKIKDRKGLQILFPERWTIEGLLRRKLIEDLSSTTSFDAEYQCEIMSEETALVKQKWLEAIKDPDLSYIYNIEEVNLDEFRFIIQSWDLSFIDSKKKAEERDGDYTIGYTIGVDEDYNKVLLNVYRKRGFNDPRELKNAIINLAHTFNPVRIYVENNAFQNFLVKELKDETHLPILPHTTTGKNKYSLEDGLPYLASQIQLGKFKLPYRTKEDKQMTNILCNELHGFGKEPHDDMAMCLWIGTLGVKKYTKYLKNEEIQRMIYEGTYDPEQNY